VASGEALERFPLGVSHRLCLWRSQVRGLTVIGARSALCFRHGIRKKPAALAIWAVSPAVTRSRPMVPLDRPIGVVEDGYPRALYI